eukprot:1567869-Pyramimonas_sp.AAC.1
MKSRAVQILGQGVTCRPTSPTLKAVPVFSRLAPDWNVVCVFKRAYTHMLVSYRHVLDTGSHRPYKPTHNIVVLGLPPPTCLE